MSDVWHYAEGDEQRGPVSLDTLAALVRNGRIKPDTLVWRDGLAQWASASTQVPQIFQPTQAIRAQPLSYAEPELNPASAPARLVELLRAARPWARLCGVVTVLCGIICGLLTFFLVIGFLNKPDPAVLVSGVFLGGVTLILLPAGFSINRIASGVVLLEATGRMNELEGVLEAHRAFWRRSGYLLIAAAGLLAITVIVAGVAGTAKGG